MKISVNLTLDIDPEAYLETYGISIYDLRKDVQNHAKHILYTDFEHVLLGQ